MAQTLRRKTSSRPGDSRLPDTSTLQDFEQEALRIVNEAQKDGIPLRLMGASAVKMHSVKYKALFEEMERTLTDLDFMTYGRYSKFLTKLFRRLGYEPNESFIQMHGHIRHIYLDRAHRRIADVFLDKLSFCHTVDFQNRLELDSPTITLADLLLEKMQIVHINEKDIKDTIILLAEHEIGESDKETVDVKRIAELLSDDWGFYYTVQTNLRRVAEYAEKKPAWPAEVKKAVGAKVEAMLGRMEAEPKSFRWKMRAKVGTSKKWYDDVEEVER
jgi:hypothetical protein